MSRVILNLASSVAIAAAAIGSVTFFSAPAYAQVAESELTTLLASLETVCTSNPSGCEAEMARVLQVIRTSGADSTAVNAQIGAAVGTVVRVADAARTSGAVDTAVLTSLSTAVSVASDPNRGYVGTPGTASYDALVSSVTAVSNSVASGEQVSSEDLSTAVSGTPS